MRALGPDAPQGDAADAGRPRFRVLGPLRVEDTVGPLRLGGPKERLVLGVLLARAGETVSVDTFIDTLWADDPPRSAERTIHSYVSRLRRVLERSGPGVNITTDGRGYRLVAADQDIDARAFETAARTGHAALSAGSADAQPLLTAALAMWTGEPYAELTSAEPCASEARRLSELRLSLQEDLAEALLLAGTSGVVPDFEKLVAEEPFRERRWQLLMTALYRDGRQREALAAFQRARQVLADEVGVEPGPELRATESAVLAHDPTLLHAPVPESLGNHLPLALDTFGMPLIGRQPQVTVLRAGWERAVDGRGGLIAVRGPIGAGKSHLAASFAGEVHATGAVVLNGRCDHAVRGASGLVRTLLRSAGVTLGAIFDGTEDDADLAETFVGFVTVERHGRPVLIVLDDLHLADSATLEFVADLAAWSAAAPIMVLAVFTVDSAGIDDAGPPNGANEVHLGALDRASIAQICAMYDAESWSSAALDAVVETTGGLPLYVHETAATMARQDAMRRVARIADRAVSARQRMASADGELAEGIGELQRLADRRRTIAMSQALQRSDPTQDACPYKALSAFEFDDAASFFGREELVAELVSRMASSSLLLVVGPSGSGKSSVVRAGLLPALADGALPGSDHWNIDLVRRPAEPNAIVDLSTPTPAVRNVVVVDQAEELFTGVDDADRETIVGRLLDLIDDPTATVVLTMRSDYLDRWVRYPGVASRLTGHAVLVGAMTDDELRRTIELPVRRLGLDLEPGLTEIVLEEVRHAAAGLPLLSTALAETWARRDGRLLTIDGYRSAGAVRGAVARLAESAYASLPDQIRPNARRVFVRLADDGEAGPVRRRRIVADLVATDPDAGPVIDRFVDHRLLVRDGDVVEVAHEALLHEWPRLRDWIDVDVADRQIRQRVVEGARAWTVDGRAELLRGASLERAVDWSSVEPAQASEVERRYIAASVDASERELREAQQRLVAERRSKRRLGRALAVAAVLLAVAAMGAAIAVVQRNRADEASAAAQDERRRADELAVSRDVQRLGAIAQVQEDVDLSFLLAAQAAATDPGVATDSLLLSALLRSPRALGIFRSSGPRFLALAVDPTGRWVALNENEGGVTVIDAESMTAVAHVDGPNGGRALAWQPDGELLAMVGSVEPRAGGGDVVVHLVDPRLRSPRELTGLTDVPAAFAFSTDGRRLAAITTGELAPDGAAQVAVWDLDASSDPIAIASVDAGRRSVDAELWFRSGNAELVVPSGDQDLVVLQVPTLTRLETIDGIADASTSTSRAWLASAALDNESVTLLQNLTNGDDRALLLGHSAQVFSRVFSPDDRLLATTSDDRTVKVWNVQDGRLWTDLTGHAGRVLGAQFSPDGRTLYTAGLDRAVIAWDVSGDRGFVRRLDRPDQTPARYSDFRVVTSDGRYVVAPVAGDAVEVTELAGETSDRRVVAAGHGETWIAVPTPDGAAVLTGGADGAIRRLAIDDGQPEAELAPPEGSFRYPLATSHEGPVALAQRGDHDVELLDAVTLEPIGTSVTLDGLVGVAAYSDGDDRIALTTIEPRRVVVLDATDLSVIESTETTNEPTALAWSADGRTLIVGGHDGVVRRYDSSSLTPLGPPVSAHDGVITSIDVDPDGETFVTSGSDGVADVWDLATGYRRFAIQAGPQNRAAWVSWLPTDRLRITYNWGETFDVDLRSEQWFRQACDVANRSLSDDERAEFLIDPDVPSAC